MSKTKNILLVDDYPAALITMSAGLDAHRARFRTLTAASGREAIKLLEAARIDLVVSDMKMPDISGEELFDHIFINYPAMPLVAMTGYSEDVQQKLKIFGLHRILAKPFSLAQLSQAIQLELDAAICGTVSNTPVDAALSMLEKGRKTAFMLVTCDTISGCVYVENGAPVGAKSGGLSGTAALEEMQLWGPVDIEFVEPHREALGHPALADTTSNPRRGENAIQNPEEY